MNKTGFWVNADNTRVLWARDNGSDKRSELWELSEDFDSYSWDDVSREFREYGFAGYLAILSFQGWSCVPQPNGFTKNTSEMPKLPYPGGMLSGGTADEGAWHYMPSRMVDATCDSEAEFWPARWVCNKAECVDDIRDMPDHFEEPEPVTAEIPEIPPKINTKAVSYATLPDLMPAKDCPELQGLGKIRHFRNSAGRKVAYVASADGKCVVAYRARYERGSDKQLEASIKAFVSKLGFDLTA
ncbi:hypothetical protein [Bifidobacterium olomucense]|uniref:Uncharacterized protein n=1 Tax=Bifidobacterium olomucense TaxID=2675324 RepID=A0A7Y0EXB3_9BIFI|nr:hypothetical protein [Bifidobacterium sp. DSM 109959]NMM98135.1 hypothetical protein [Bifidobacterium sp. DSM 109959]